jgi:hypothetical protein
MTDYPLPVPVVALMGVETLHPQIEQFVSKVRERERRRENYNYYTPSPVFLPGWLCPNT